MTQQEIEQRLELRRRQAERIKAEPHLYKVCLVCSSTSFETASVCKVCKSYQWSADPELIARTVDEAAKNPIPFTLGYDLPAGKREYKLPTFAQS